MGLGEKLGDIFGLPPKGDNGEEEIFENEAQNEKEREKVSRSVQSMMGGTKMEFILVKPEKYDEGVTIGNHLIERKTVVLNLEGTGKEAARRIVDFLSGVAFAMRAQIKKVSIATYIIIPQNSNMSGDDVEDIEVAGMFY